MVRSWLMLLGGVALGLGQTPPSPRFDAAVVRQHGSDPRRGIWGGPGTSDRGRIRYVGMPLSLLIDTAYDVSPELVVAPDWINTEWYDVEATMPPETDKKTFQLMMRNLLADQFRLALHSASVEMSVLVMSAPKGVSFPPAGAAPGSPVSRFLSDSIGTLRSQSLGNGNDRMFSPDVSMTEIAASLSGYLHKLVIDETNLGERYTVDLVFRPEVPAAFAGLNLPEGDAPPLRDAIQRKTGLVLSDGKRSATRLVVDHIDKVPVGN